MSTFKERDDLKKQIQEMDINTFLITFLFRMGRYYMRKRFYVTAQGRLALAPSLAIEGDIVCFFNGLPLPFVLGGTGGKNDNSEQHHTFVGGCYGNGMMSGYGKIPHGHSTYCNDLQYKACKTFHM